MGRKHKKHKSEREARDLEEDKPGLKLVLKVGGEPVDSTPPAGEPEHHRHHKHKKKKKKKSSDKDKDRHKPDDKDKDRHKPESRKRRHEDEETVPSIDGGGDATASLTQDDITLSEVDDQRTESTMEEGDTSQAEDEDRESRSVPLTVIQETQRGSQSLHKLLDYLHKVLQKKDLQGIFAYPVTDDIAPMYSQIISQPMDFSTIKEKMTSFEYLTVAEFRNDFQVMCTNCMTYNRPDTIYYKAAKKLLGSGLRQMSKDQIVKLTNTLGFNVEDGELDLGADESIDLEAMEETSTNEIVKQLGAKPKEDLEPGDNMTPEEILAQAQAAAKGAADRLTLRQANGKMGFLRQRQDGTTTLNILNPDNQGIVSEKERVISLGKLLGKPQGGMGNIAGFKEDKRNAAKPVNYLNYGPFSSYAPIYDTSFATIPKEESDLLLSTYGDEAGIQYAKSLQHFVEEAGDFSTRMVDRMLDIITGGEHSKTVKILQQNEEQAKKVEQTGTNGDLLSDALVPEGNQSNETTKPSGPSTAIQEKLDSTADLLHELNETQHKRLSGRPPMHLALVQGPSQKETELADKVMKELTALTKQVQPLNVVPAEGVRTALGIDTEDISDVIMDDDT